MPQRKGPYRHAIRIVETGQVYKSIREAAKAIGGLDSVVGQCLKGKRKTHMGYSFKYLGEPEAIPQSDNSTFRELAWP